VQTIHKHALVAFFACLFMSPFLSLANAKQANEGEIEGFALQLRTKSKHKATKGYANACL
jgi:hypothetical protein